MSAGLLLAPIAFSSPIVGTFGITSGSGNATVGATSLIWQCFVGGCPANNGDFTTTGGSGSFSGSAGTRGFITNLNTGNAPLNTAFLLSNFMTFLAPLNDIALDLRFINLGVSGSGACGAGPVAGQICTPEGIPGLVTGANPTGRSAFNLQNLTTTSSTASLSVSGTARRISTGELSNFTGTFSATFDTLSYQALLGQLCPTTACTGSVQTPYSATFSVTAAAVPEPMTGAMIGFSLLGLGLLRRFRG